MFFRRVYRFSRALPALLAVSVLLPAVVVAGPSAADTGGFGDVDGGVHEPGIDALADEGILDGTECGNGLFCPSEPILRSVMAVWLVRALGESPSEESGSRFSDMDSDEWWSPHVERLADLGVTAGCATDPLRFCPDKAVTRAQMATFLVRAFDLEAAASAGFADTSGNTHEDSIDTLAAADITAGCGTDPLRYCPSKSVTRAQMATFLARALDLIPKPRSEPETTSQPLLAYSLADDAEMTLAYYLEDASGTYQNRFAEASYDANYDADSVYLGLKWSPDGNYLAYDTPGGSVFVVDFDGTNRRQLIEDYSSQYEKDFVWSPDGNRVAYQTSEGWFVVDSDGTNLRQLTEGYFQYEKGFDWSPDGNKVAYKTSDGLFVVDFDGTNLRQLTEESFQYEKGFDWSPDGNKVAYNASDGLFVVDFDGTNLRQLTETKAFPQYGNGFDWSPDGNYLMYVIGGLYMPALFIVESDGSNRRQIRESETGILGYEWSYSPDGRQLLLYTLSCESDRCEPWASPAFLANADGTGLRPYSGPLDWSSPDSTVIHIGRVEGADGQWIVGLFAENPDGTNRRQLSELSPSLLDRVCYAVSPDGNHVAYTVGYRDLFIVDSDGTNRRQLADNISGSCPTWRPIGS